MPRESYHRQVPQLPDPEHALAVRSRDGISDLDLASFTSRLKSENHTLKRALTDPRLFAGIGNAYSDEVLHRARLSPIALTSSVTHEEIKKLYAAIGATLEHGQRSGAPVQRIVYAENETNYCARSLPE
jgi:formamidopyrimidine-DNA glycosylase